MLAPQKESIFSPSCRLWLLSWRRARVFARSCSLLSKYLPISWKQRKEQSYAQCHDTHRIRIFDKISEHVKVAKSVDIAVPELAVTWHKLTQLTSWGFPPALIMRNSDCMFWKVFFSFPKKAVRSSAFVEIQAVKARLFCWLNTSFHTSARFRTFCGTGTWPASAVRHFELEGIFGPCYHIVFGASWGFVTHSSKRL